LSNLAHQYDEEDENDFLQAQEERAARKARLSLIQGGGDEEDDAEDDDYSPADDDGETPDNVVSLDEHREKKAAATEPATAGELKDQESDVAMRARGFTLRESEDGFYRDESDVKKRRGLRGRLKGRGSRAGLIAGGVGITGIIALFSLGGFLAVFRLDHILKNIDYKTFSRYNATVDGLSKNYIKSYMKIRMMEFANAGKDHLGDKEGNLFFRADKVYTGNPTLDWYRTLRTSDFEKDVFNKNGIFFTSSVDANGKIRPAKITVRDEIVDLDSDANLSKKIRDISPAIVEGNPTKLAAALNRFGPAMDSFVEKEFFSNDKAARKEIKKVVQDNTKFYNVLKRRQLRKSIQNMVGVRSWTFFEQTKAAYRQKKQDITHKILSKVFGGNTETAKLLNCIFTGSCSTANDVNNPEVTKESGKLAGIDEDTSTETDVNGKTTTKVENLGNEEVGKIGTEELENIEKETVDDVGKTGGSVSQRLIQALVKKYVGEAAADATPDPSKVWKYAKIIAKFHKMITDHKISKMVKRAKLVQLMAIYTAYAVARDQSHTGQMTMEEYSDLIKTTDNFNNSEGWQAISGGGSPTSFLSTPTAYAASVTNLPKAEYCKGTHQKKQDEFAWFCDDQKPNNGGVAGSLEAAYSSSIGIITGPIAAVVSTLKSIPLLDQAASFFSDLSSKIIGAVSGPVINAVLDGTGLGKDITGLFTMITTKLLDFLGAGPMFTGTEPGIGNFLLAGSAGAAENATRAIGGIKSTPTSLNYSNKLAANWLHEQRADQSMFERYASVSNPDSLLSNSLFALSNTKASDVPGGFMDEMASIPRMISSMFMPRAFAASNGSDLASLTGVDTNDLPQVCQQLDPLDPQYLQKATNAWSLGITPDWNVLKDSTLFWQKVYDKVGADNEDAANEIYNCETAYQVVRGGLGATSGYTDDGQDLNSGGSASTPSSTGAGSSTTAPTGNGKWSVAAGANRPGSSLTPLLTAFLDQVAQYTSYEPVVTTGTNHNKYVQGSTNISDHYSGNGADFGSVVNNFGTSKAQPNQVVPRGDELAAAGMIACGTDPTTAHAQALKGGVYSMKCTVNGQNVRVQVLWKTDEGGNHHNHVHIGIKAI
jgi:hypothetical protein